MLTEFLDSVTEDRLGVSPRRLSEALKMGVGDLSRIAHLHRNTLAKNPGSPKVQDRLGEIARIVALAAELTGDTARAVVWFRHQPLAGFDGRTAEQLVEDGHGGAVLKHLEMLRDGGYA
jgi:uncharacterized protein (DUF2384 family)